MSNITFRILTAVLTFSLGIAVFILWPLPYEVAKISIPQSSRYIPKGWKEVEVKDNFSFYLPPDMESLEFSCYPESGGIDLLVNQDLTLLYGFDERVSCDKLSNIANKAPAQTLNVEINSRKAVLGKWVMNRYSRMYLCFPEAGRGKMKLNMLVIYDDEKGAEIARQIFNSVEFR